MNGSEVSGIEISVKKQHLEDNWICQSLFPTYFPLFREEPFSPQFVEGVFLIHRVIYNVPSKWSILICETRKGLIITTARNGHTHLKLQHLGRREAGEAYVQH
jgi:hypothetical protein